MNVLKIAALALITSVAVGLGILLSGVFNVAADDPHWAATRWLLEAARDRSIAARAGGITIPPLGDPTQIAIGAEHYCVAGSIPSRRILSMPQISVPKRRSGSSSMG